MSSAGPEAAQTLQIGAKTHALDAAVRNREQQRREGRVPVAEDERRLAIDTLEDSSGTLPLEVWRYEKSLG